MKIGILQTGHSDKALTQEYGDFDDMFKVLLGDYHFSFETYNVVDSIFPSKPEDADGWLITGSKHSSYEDLAWIATTEDFLRKTYAKKIPIVGICFGHQLLAQALGGKVEQFSQGWSIGNTPYTVEGNSKDENRNVNIAAWHQDQVTVLPDDAVCTGSSDFCKYAFIEYGETAYSIQAHPEFTSKFINELVSLRSASMPEELVIDAQNKSTLELDTAYFAKQISDFFKSRR